jgi:hypothetical protein
LEDSIMVTVKHWQDPLNAALGACVALSPWVLGVQGEQAITANSVTVGILLIAAALGATFVPRAWEEWVEGALGLWLIASPWVLGFAGARNPMILAVIAGLAIVALALWVLVTDEAYRGSAHRLEIR